MCSASWSTPGDAIKKDQPVLELETDKATIEVPSSADGVVKEIKVKPGEKVKVGQTIFIVDEDGAGRRPPKRRRSRQRTQSRAAEARSGEGGAQGRSAEAQSRCRRDEAVQTCAVRSPRRPCAVAAPKAAARSASIPAAPSARRLARELGVNIQDIQGSGPAGRISMDDVTAYARRLLRRGARHGRPAAGAQRPAGFQQVGRRSSASR